MPSLDTTELYVPPSARYFEPRRGARGLSGAADQAELGDAAFAYDLVEALRPRLAVDVGAGAGTSFVAMCQSMRDHAVDGLAYAIDPFADDEGKAEGDETSSASLNDVLRAHYRGHSYLLRRAPAEARIHFAPASVDLLRIDAPRLGEPLGVLLQDWLPTLAAGGVLLCPGVVRQVGLGEAFRAATGGGPVLGLGAGLGVHRIPSDGDGASASPLLALITSADPEERASLSRFYEHLSLHHALRVELEAHRLELARRRPAP